MSEIKLNLIDSQTILCGTIHGSIGDACVAALSAEPETIPELEAALARFIKPDEDQSAFAFLRSNSSIDERPYDAGILIIDLAARIVACDSTYSRPGARGVVNYHNGKYATDVPAYYRLSDDWLFVGSVEEYSGVCEQRRQERLAIEPLDARVVLYGRPLSEFIARELLTIPPASLAVLSETHRTSNGSTEDLAANAHLKDDESDVVKVLEASHYDPGHPLQVAIRDIHERWLVTPREDLRNQSPRDVMLAKQDFIDTDLDRRRLQWSILLEGPPCISKESFAYRFAGFGSHEWIIYYDLVRELIWTAAVKVLETFFCQNQSPEVPPANLEDHLKLTEQQNYDSFIDLLEQVKTDWLEQPLDDTDGHIPAQIIENERKRLPEAMGGRSMVIDENCPCCKMMGDESEAGLGVYFWHLDGCNMDDDFAFSSFKTKQEWEAQQKLNEEFNREWNERKERLARGETLEPDPFFDPPELSELADWQLVTEPESPES
jgi:hypothetical protein